MTRSQLLFLLVATSSLLLCAQAFAQQSADLVKYASKGGVVAGMNVRAAKGSAAMTQMLEIAGTSKSFKRAMARLGALGIQPSKDVNALLFVAPSPKGKSSVKSRTFSLIISGDFDAAALAKKIEQSEGAKKLGASHYQIGKGSEAFLGKGVVVIAGGSDSWRKRAMKQASSAKKSGLSSGMRGRIKRLDTSKHLWVAVDASSVKTGSQGKLREALLEGDLSSGLSMKGSVKFKEEADATDALAKFEENRSKVNMGAAVIGAPSLAKTLTMTRAGKALKFRASMPEKEVVATGTWLKNYIKASSSKK